MDHINYIQCIVYTLLSYLHYTLYVECMDLAPSPERYEALPPNKPYSFRGVPIGPGGVMFTGRKGELLDQDGEPLGVEKCKRRQERVSKRNAVYR